MGNKNGKQSEKSGKKLEIQSNYLIKEFKDWEFSDLKDALNDIAEESINAQTLEKLKIHSMEDFRNFDIDGDHQLSAFDQKDKLILQVYFRQFFFLDGKISTDPVLKSNNDDEDSEEEEEEEEIREDQKTHYFDFQFHEIVKRLVGSKNDKQLEEVGYKKCRKLCYILSNRSELLKFIGLSKKEEIEVGVMISESLFRTFLFGFKETFHFTNLKLPESFGIMLSGIVLHDRIFQWNRDNLIIPQKIDLGAFYKDNVRPLPDYTLKKETDDDQTIEEIVNKVCDLVMEYNTKKSFDSRNKRECEDFILQFISLFKKEEKNDEQQQQNIIPSIPLQVEEEEEKEGEGEGEKKKRGAFLSFAANERFMESFKIKEYLEKENLMFRIENNNGDDNVIHILSFRTHKELDQFLNHIFVQDFMNRKKDFEMEYFYLKSIDRVFWMRYLDSKMKNEDFAPLEGTQFDCLMEHKKCGCCFSDPRVTGSFD